MLILAGVSLNAIVGDNGIISNAQNANVKSGIAALEEFLQEKYVENYDSIQEGDDKATALRNLYSSWFYSPHTDDNVGNNDYVVYSYTDENGITSVYDLYLIKKSGLPKKIREGLVGGEANGGGYLNYALLNDVYGITSDLKVYYCSEGLNSMISISNISFTEDDPQKVVFSKDSAFANLIGDGTGDITANDLKSVKDITISSTSGINSLSELYALNSLNKLTLNGVHLDSLNGLENATKVYSIWIQDCTIGDYSAISKLGSNLNKLYIYLTPSFEDAQQEVDKLLSIDKGIQGGEFANLEYFGIFGDQTYLVNNSFNWPGGNVRNGVIDISKLENFTQTTKDAVKYVYFQSCSITDISCLNHFNKIETIVLDCTNIKTFNGLQNSINLNRIQAWNCKDLGDDEIYNPDDEENEYGKNPIKDALSYIPQNTTSKLYLRVTGAVNLKFISYCTSWNISTLNCDSINLGENDLKKCVNVYKLKRLIINSKYWNLFNDEEKMDLKNKNLTNSSLKLELDGNYSTLKYLRLDGNTLLTDSVNEGDVTLSSILNQCTKMEALSLKGITGLNNVDFVRNMPNLVELNILNCSNIIDLSVLEELTVNKKLALKTLCVNTYATKTVNGVSVLDMSKTIDLTAIQSVISSFGARVSIVCVG